MRTPGEVRADMEALEASGKKNPKKKGMLRTELIDALEAENEALKVGVEPGPISISVPSDWNAELVSGSPFETREWHFLEKALAELDTSIRSSVKTKLLYNALKDRLTIWRIGVKIVQALGTDAKWPQFAVLGLAPEDGAVVHEHSILSEDYIPSYKPPVEGEMPKVAAPDPAAVPAPAAMPMGASAQAAAAAARGVPTMEDMTAQIKRDLAGTLGGGPQQEMTKAELEAATVE